MNVTSDAGPAGVRVLAYLAAFAVACITAIAVCYACASPAPPAAPDGLARFPPERGCCKVLVLKVVDGDTVDVAFLVPARVRLYGVNAPEHGTPEGDGATKLLQALLPEGAVVGAELHGREKYGRLLAVVNTAKDGDVSRKLLEAGRAKPWDGKGPRP